MREIDEERLEHMFPDGYSITYVAPDGSTRIRVFNPLAYKKLHETIQTWEKVYPHERRI